MFYWCCRRGTSSIQFSTESYNGSIIVKVKSYLTCFLIKLSLRLRCTVRLFILPNLFNADMHSLKCKRYSLTCLLHHSNLLCQHHHTMCRIHGYMVRLSREGQQVSSPLKFIYEKEVGGGPPVAAAYPFVPKIAGNGFVEKAGTGPRTNCTGAREKIQALTLPHPTYVKTAQGAIRNRPVHIFTIKILTTIFEFSTPSHKFHLLRGTRLLPDT